ncbi:MAG: hypothetical protein WCK10_03690 [Candidatus Staskawiczbacteria bacterium]
MPRNIEAGSTEPEQEELTDQERIEKEKENMLAYSERCGATSYFALTGKLPPKEFKPAGDEKNLDFLFFGELNIKPEKPLLNPEDYIKTFAKHIEEVKQRNDKPMTEKQIEDAKEITYISSVDGKGRKVTDENWRRYSFAGTKEHNELVIEQMQATLKGFSQTALESGDEKTHDLVQEILSVDNYKNEGSWI